MLKFRWVRLAKRGWERWGLGEVAAVPMWGAGGLAGGKLRRATAVQGQAGACGPGDEGLGRKGG